MISDRIIIIPNYYINPICNKKRKREPKCTLCGSVDVVSIARYCKDCKKRKENE